MIIDLYSIKGETNKAKVYIHNKQHKSIHYSNHIAAIRMILSP